LRCFFIPYISCAVFSWGGTPRHSYSSSPPTPRESPTELREDGESVVDPSVTQSNIAPQTSTGTAASPPSNSYLTELAQEDAASLDSANSIQTAAYAPTTTATTQTSTPTTVTTTSSTSVSSTTSTSSAQTSISQVGISPAEFETGLAWGLVAGAAIGTLFFPPLILAVPPLIGGALAISDYSSIEGSQSTWGGGAAAWTEGAGRVLEAEDSILGDVFEMPLF
jgi:hypothetical protein